MEHCVFIHTNHKQMVGALVSKYSMKRHSRHPDRFEVKILNTADYPWLKQREGQEFMRDGVSRIWHYDDLQSFTPLRFLPPELMGYQGRAVITDPDIFAVGDVWELLSRDMQGKAVLCRPRGGAKALIQCMATSVMLMDCAKLSHWHCEAGFNELFEGKRDYMDWICLKLEPRESLGFFEKEWNDFDRLTPGTKMLHNTKRKTQPWKTGLPVDFTPVERYRMFPPFGWLMRARRILFGPYAFLGNYRPHPDPNQEAFFFGLLKECIEQGIVSEDMLREEMASNHVRPDAFEVLDRVPSLARVA